MPEEFHTLTEATTPFSDSHSAVTGPMLGLAIAYCAEAPERVGEVGFVPPASSYNGEVSLGRGAGAADGGYRVGFVRIRPGRVVPCAPLANEKISRAQLRLSAQRNVLRVENVGRARVYYNGVECSGANLSPGDTLLIGSQLLLICVERHPTLAHFDEAWSQCIFGTGDSFGIVGESAAAWELRRQLSFVAKRAGHCLILGESGVGKELAARAIHMLSDRKNRPWVARNAATIPEGLVDAELFGNLKNYPNPGMVERAGLIGEANGGTLFFDEFAELPMHVQPHLLRVLDAGEYQRLGEAKQRHADFRMVAATNRPLSHLKHDLAARFPFRVHVPSLAERREDIPLLVRHLLKRISQNDPGVANTFFTQGSSSGEPRVSPQLLDKLIRRSFQTNTRELESLLWGSIANSQGDTLSTLGDLGPPSSAAGVAPSSEPEFRSPYSIAPPPPSGTPLPVSSVVPNTFADPEADRVQRALDESNGVLEKAWRILGLSSRHALARLIKKHHLEVRRRSG